MRMSSATDRQHSHCRSRVSNFAQTSPSESSLVLSKRQLLTLAPCAYCLRRYSRTGKANDNRYRTAEIHFTFGGRYRSSLTTARAVERDSCLVIPVGIW
jgi:hypothetical protein